MIRHCKRPQLCGVLTGAKAGDEFDDETASPVVRADTLTTPGLLSAGAVFNQGVDSMKDMGSLMEQDDHNAALDRAYETADELSAADTPERRRANDLLVIHAMETYGGEFIRRLGHAAAVADDGNLRVIKEAFAFHWKRYRDEAERRARHKR